LPHRGNIINTVGGGNITHLPQVAPKINLAIGKPLNENMIYTELPPELQNFTTPVSNIFPQPISSNSPTSLASPVQSVSPVVTIGDLPPLLKETSLEIGNIGGATGAGELDKFEEIIETMSNSKTSLELSTPTFSPIKLTDDAPYGCLKNGKKPTFRMYNKTIRNNIKFDDKNNNEGSNSLSDRQSKLKELQNKHSKKKYTNSHSSDSSNDEKIPFDSNSEDDVINIKEHKKTKIRRHLRKTITKKFKLGKQPGSNTVGVLIKNNDTRKNIQKEYGLLKNKQLSEIKKYLVDKNLIKIGSTAPPGVIRNIYEASMLTGEVDNIGKGVILHNFLEDKTPW
jgi:hypothetical protein